jgi:hypothetical protein
MHLVGRLAAFAKGLITDGQEEMLPEADLALLPEHRTCPGATVLTCRVERVVRVEVLEEGWVVPQPSSFFLIYL